MQEDKEQVQEPQKKKTALKIIGITLMVISSPVICFLGIRWLFSVIVYSSTYIMLVTWTASLLILAIDVVWVVIQKRAFSKNKRVIISTWLLFLFSVIFFTYLWFGRALHNIL
ncbi:hypothetical protein ACFL3G_04720 [Planctomycetota bacterium]